MRLVTEDEVVAVYRATIDPLYAQVSRRCGGDRDLSEDIVQEAWLRAVRAWAERGIPDKPLAWLTTVARNLLLNELRRRRMVSLDAPTSGEILKMIEQEDTQDQTAHIELVTQALSYLPRRQSWLLETFYLRQWRTSQVAEHLGISERAVEGRLRRARENLRRQLDLLTQTQVVLL